MNRIVIFGNSGSGKSTLAKQLSENLNVPHLDLDTIAWRSDQPTVRKSFAESCADLLDFINQAESWVIEGCYSDLLRQAAKYSNEVIFLNPGIEACIENCKSRPWEPHKYPSREAQDTNLAMLMNWVREYETRQDEFSLQSHRTLFDEHAGYKIEYTTREQAEKRSRELTKSRRKAPGK